MNEPFVRKIYESGSDSVGSGIQDGLNSTASSSRISLNRSRPWMRLFSLRP